MSDAEHKALERIATAMGYSLISEGSEIRHDAASYVKPSELAEIVVAVLDWNNKLNAFRNGSDAGVHPAGTGTPWRILDLRDGWEEVVSSLRSEADHLDTIPAATNAGDFRAAADFIEAVARNEVSRPQDVPPSLACPICNQSWALHDYASGDHCPPRVPTPAPTCPNCDYDEVTQKVINDEAYWYCPRCKDDWPVNRPTPAPTAPTHCCGAQGFGRSLDDTCPACEESAKSRNAPTCRGCFRPLVVEERIADGCPCNSPRGVNHGLVPTHVCTCSVCDPAQTGSVRTPPRSGVSEAEVDRAHDTISDIGPDEQFVPGFRNTDFYRRIRRALEDFRGSPTPAPTAETVIRTALRMNHLARGEGGVWWVGGRKFMDSDTAIDAVLKERGSPTPAQQEGRS